MSPTRLVQNEFAKFLADGRAEVLCVRGKWGVGKTFTWQQSLDTGISKGNVRLTRYSYVSLFGVTSLDGLKLSIFENTTLLARDAGTTAQVKKGINSILPWVRQSRAVAAELPGIGDLLKAAGPLFFQAVRNQIICIDDLERRGTDLRVSDVLGLVSFLKEQRACKVVLLLNEEELGDDGTKDFTQYFEKVVDVSLTFAPTPEETAGIALPAQDELSQTISASAIALRIANIRVLKKIERLVKDVQPHVATLDKRVLAQAVKSLVLFGWCKFQPKQAPPLDYLRAHTFMDLREEEEKPLEQQQWDEVLRQYEFGSVDEFDSCLLDGLGQGYFDVDLLKRRAADLNTAIVRQEEENSLSDAWGLFRDSFANNETLVVDKIYAASTQYVASLTPYNLNSTVKILRSLGRGEHASNLIATYVATRKESAEFWDLDDNDFLNARDTDPEIATSFKARLGTMQARRNPVGILKRINEMDTWGSEDLVVLSTLSADQIYDLLKTHTGRELRSLVKGALKFRNISHPSPEMTTFTENAMQALRRVRDESTLNRLRLEALGAVPQ